jgi:site-specific DNA-methyltransferase (adenine-specific)
MNSYLNLNCLPELKKFPDNYFNIGVVDVNYGIGESGKNHNSRNTLVKQSNGKKVKIKNKNYHIKDWDNERPTKEYFKELFRVCEYVIIWGGNYLTDLLPEFSSGRIIWDKCNGNNDFSDCEIAWTNLFTSTRLFRYMWAGMMQGKSISEGHIMQGNKKLNEIRIHQTQKPTKLYLWTAHKFFKKGWRVLDTHVGSGSSLIAYEMLGFEYVAFEKDKDHFKDSTDRIEEFKREPMFDFISNKNQEETKKEEIPLLF